MEKKPITTCTLVCFSESPACAEVGAAFSSLRDPPMVVKRAFQGLPNSENLNATAKRIAGEKPQLVVACLTGEELEKARCLAQYLKKQTQPPTTWAVCEGGSLKDISALLESGFDDLLIPPLKRGDLAARLRELGPGDLSSDTLTRDLAQKMGLSRLIGRDPGFLKQIEKIPVVAKCDAGVLISGESGSGKELVARAIHHLSRRANKPFIAAGCGTLPVDIVENELFGHVRGAYTGADTDQDGLIQEAQGGTLFLDEIDCLPHRAQVKLVRFIQEKEYKQLGSGKLCRADVRLIAASNADLEQQIQNGRFRQDLYYRLNVIPLLLPPLRRRKQDISLLARHFLQKYAFEHRKGFRDLSPEALQKINAYHWPGNVRELENIIQRAVILSKTVTLRDTDIDLPDPAPAAGKVLSFQEAKSRFIRTYIADLLQNHHGNITRAAQSAHKDRRAFWELMRRYGVSADEFRTH